MLLRSPNRAPDPTIPRMLYVMLKTAIRLAAGLSEFTLLFNIWIISPFTDHDQRPYTWLLPSFCSVCFAISEPLYISLFVRIPLAPTYLAFMVPVTQVLVFIAFWEARDFVALEQGAGTSEYARRTRNASDAQCEAALDAPRVNSIAISSAQNFDAKPFWGLAFAHVQTAAATTASLLLAAQNMDATRITSHALHVFLVACAFVYFGASRLADHSFARCARLPYYFGQGGTWVAAAQIKNLVWLIAVRAAMRVALGVNAISGPFGADGSGVKFQFSEAAIRQAIESVPLWAWCAVSALCLCLMALGMSITRRAEADVRDGRID